MAVVLIVVVAALAPAVDLVNMRLATLALR
jgi:hypothetical protein